MKDERMDKLKKDYMDTPIPDELDFITRKALNEGRKTMKRKSSVRKLMTTAVSAAVLVVMLMVGVNTSHVLAEGLLKVPVVGSIVRVLRFKEIRVDEGGYHAEIDTPRVEGLENKKLEDSLNKKYMEENKELYESFMKDMEELKKAGGGHLGVDSGYVVKTDNDEILSIGRYVVNTVASSSTVIKYDTIDKKREILITLPSLFEDDSYVEIISGNVKEQMLKNNKSDEEKIYWVEGIGDTELVEVFEKISADQNFYISDKGKLIISFDKYEVAPGYMGVVEFEIPTEILAGILVGNDYIK